jgi:hypothetical protein
VNRVAYSIGFPRVEEQDMIAVGQHILPADVSDERTRTRENDGGEIGKLFGSAAAVLRPTDDVGHGNRVAAEKRTEVKVVGHVDIFAGAIV